MRSYRIPFPVLLLAAACAGCGPSHEAAPPPPPAAPQAVAEDKGPPLRGTIPVSKESLSLHECGTVDGHTIELLDPGKELMSLPGIGLPKDLPLYVELRGAASSDGRAFTIARVERARAAHEGIPCDPPVFAGDFQVRGQEPFFAIDILETGIVYRSPDEPKGVTYPYGVTPNASGLREYASKIEGAHASTLDVILEPGRCIDPMSGEIFAYKAHVTRNEKKLDGCAAAGVPTGGFGDAPLDELERWLGTYPAAATWTTPPLGPRLDALLGSKAAAFRQNIAVRSPLMRDGGVYYVLGNKPHQGGIDNAIFLADPASDTINVILFRNGARQDFKEGDREVEPPDEVKTAIANVTAR